MCVTDLDPDLEITEPEHEHEHEHEYEQAPGVAWGQAGPYAGVAWGQLGLQADPAEDDLDEASEKEDTAEAVKAR